jgi:quercetin dioxygenase-like cupin family protein
VQSDVTAKPAVGARSEGIRSALTERRVHRAIRENTARKGGRGMPFYESKDIQEMPPVNGIASKAVYGNNVSVSFLEFPAHSTIPPHAHSNEQIGVVTDAALHYTIYGESKLCPAGAAFVIPPNAVHSARVVSNKPAKMIDVFTPSRNIMEPLSYTER